MKHLQMTLICIAIAALSFALGWYMRGDAIYSAMYMKDKNNTNVESLRDEKLQN